MLRVGRVAAETGWLPTEPRVADLRERGRERLRVGVHRRGEDVLGRSLLDDLARVHDREPVRDLDEHREIVGDEEHREPEVVLERFQQSEDLRLDHHVERGGRLVGDDQRRVAGQGHRDHHALLLSAGQLVRVVVDPPAGQADLLEQRRPDRARACLAA